MLEIFLESDNNYCVMVDGDDFLTPHGVWMYKNLESLDNTPDAEAEGYTAYADINESQVIDWVKGSIGDEGVTAIESAIAAQIAESKTPAVSVGTPW